MDEISVLKAAIEYCVLGDSKAVTASLANYTSALKFVQQYWLKLPKSQSNRPLFQQIDDDRSIARQILIGPRFN